MNIIPNQAESSCEKGLKVWQGHSHSSQQTEALGRTIGEVAQAGDLIAMVGELGAGKTQLVRGLVDGVGIDTATVSSPTFVLMQQYAHPSGHPVVIHMDAYRLVGEDDAESIGWGTDLFQSAVVAVEWADRLGGGMPCDRLDVCLDHVDVDRRNVLVTAHGVWCDRIDVLREAMIRAIPSE